MSRKKTTDGPAPVKNPRLQHRLPREDNAPTIPFDDPPNLQDQALALLGPHRLRIARDGFYLDGRLVNFSAVLKAANLKYRDE